MGDKNIIKSETKEGNGIYIMDIDQDKVAKIEGNTYSEKVNNAINQFLGQVQTNKNFELQTKAIK